MKRILLIFAVILSCTVRTAAQTVQQNQTSNPTQEVKLEILPDKKVLYVNRLGLPGSTAVRDVLMSIPELMSRNGVSDFGNFDVQIDGKSTGSGRDVVLEQTLISELEKVEITSSPTVDQQQNGQGGVINLIPAKLKEGLSGETFVNASTAVDVMPGVNLKYKKGNVEIRGSFNMEYYRPEELKYAETYKDAQTIYQTDTISTQYGQETAKFFLKYEPTKKDTFKLWAWESFEKGWTDQTTFRNTQWDMSETRGKGWIWEKNERMLDKNIKQTMDVSAIADYQHVTGFGSKIKANASYKYSKKKTNYLSNDRISESLNPWDLSGEVKVEHVFFDTEKQKLEINSGVNSTFSPNRRNEDEGHNLYVSPFLTLKYRIGKVNIHAGARYQYYHRHYSSPGREEFKKDEHDVTANLNVLWNINKNHALRFVATRNIIRPGIERLYPELVRNMDNGKWIQGNPDLRNTMVHAADVVYVFTKHNEADSWIVSAGIGYDVADNLIKEVVRPVPFLGPLEPEFYSTFENSGENHILRGNLALTYQRGMFSLLFSGNMFRNFNTDEAVGNNHAYFNLSVTPIFNFRRNWVLSAKVLYNSRVVTRSITYGDALVVSCNVSKTIKKWTIFAGLSDIFDYLTYDVADNKGERYVSAYDLYPRDLSVGFSYRF